MKSCPSCGKEYGDALGFCEECGSALVAVAAPERILAKRRPLAAPAPGLAAQPQEGWGAGRPSGSEKGVAARLEALEQKYGELVSRPRTAPSGAGAAVPEELRARLELVGKQQAVLDGLERELEELRGRLGNIGRAPALAAAGWEERLAGLEERVKHAESAAEDVWDLRKAVEELPSGANLQRLEELFQKAAKGGGKDLADVLAELGQRMERLESAGNLEQLAAGFEEKLRELDKWDSQLQLGLQQAATKADLNKIKAWIDQESSYLQKLKGEVKEQVSAETEGFVKREELARFRDEADQELAAVKRLKDGVPREVEKLVAKELEDGVRKAVARAEEGLRAMGTRVEEEQRQRADALQKEHAERLAGIEGMAKRLAQEHAERVKELDQFKGKVALAVALANEQRERTRAAEQKVAEEGRMVKALVESGLKGVRERMDAHEGVLVEARKEMNAVAERLRSLGGLEGKVEKALADAAGRMEARVARELAIAQERVAALAETGERLAAEQAALEQRMQAQTAALLQKELAGFRKAQAEAEAQTRRSRAFNAELKASVAGFEQKLSSELGKWKSEMAQLGERIDSRVKYFEETRQEANEKLRLVRAVVERLERRVESGLSEMEKKVGKAARAQEQLELERIAPKGK